MPWFYVPVTIVEYGRKALIEAENRREAVQKIRDGETWDSATDPSHFKVTVARGTVDDADATDTIQYGGRR